MLSACGCDKVKENLFLVNKAKQILVPRIWIGKLEVLAADVQKKPSEIVN